MIDISRKSEIIIELFKSVKTKKLRERGNYSIYFQKNLKYVDYSYIVCMWLSFLQGRFIGGEKDDSFSHQNRRKES